jgi:hypothetical protein
VKNSIEQLLQIGLFIISVVLWVAALYLAFRD